MAITLVDVGTTANDGTGDPLRTAFQTVNTALTLVDNAVVVGTGVTTFKDDSGSNGVSVLSSGFTGVGTSAPSTILHAKGAAAEIRTESTSGNVFFRAIAATTGNAYIYLENATTGSLATIFVTNSSSLTVATASGVIALSPGGTEACRVSANSDMLWKNAGASTGMTWDASANSNAGGIGIGTSTPTEQLDLSGDAIRIRTSQTPASASATGDAGMICWDASYIYVCTATNTWKRAAIATW